MAKAVKKQGAKPRKPITEFNRRVRAAREYAGLTQEKLAELVGCKQGTIDKLENRHAVGSAFTVQIAQACNVSPYWQAAHDMNSPMLRPADISDEALTIGVAWSYLKGGIRDRYARDLLEMAMAFLPGAHPRYKHADHLYRELKKKSKIAGELGATEKATSNTK